MTATIKKRFDVSVTEKSKPVSKTFELDKAIKFIKGVLLTADKDDLLYYRGTLKLEMNKEEIFPEGYEAKLLMSGISVAPNLRWYDIGQRPTGNRELKIEYQDSDDGRSQFVPYRVSLYVLAETESV
jgi:hypothetical protein